MPYLYVVQDQFYKKPFLNFLLYENQKSPDKKFIFSEKEEDILLANLTMEDAGFKTHEPFEIEYEYYYPNLQPDFKSKLDFCLVNFFSEIAILHHSPAWYIKDTHKENLRFILASYLDIFHVSRLPKYQKNNIKNILKRYDSYLQRLSAIEEPKEPAGYRELAPSLSNLLPPSK